MTILNDDLLASLDASTADVANAATLPAELYTSDEFLRVRARRAVRPRVAVRRAGVDASRTRATGSPSPSPTSR